MRFTLSFLSLPVLKHFSGSSLMTHYFTSDPLPLFPEWSFRTASPRFYFLISTYPAVQRQLQKCFLSAEEKSHVNNCICVSSLILSIPCALFLPSAAQILHSPPSQLSLESWGLCIKSILSLYPLTSPTGPQGPGNCPWLMGRRREGSAISLISE